MDKLSKEEVLHVADLGRLWLSDEEIDKFSYQLKSLFNKIDEINKIDLPDCDVMISPSSIKCPLYEDMEISNKNEKELISNAPKSFDNYVEIRGVFDE